MNITMSKGQFLVSFLSKNSKRKLTVEQICHGLNQKLMKPNVKSTWGKGYKFSPTQIATYLSKLNTSGVVTKYPSTGYNSNGRQVARWSYSNTIA